MEFWFCAVVVVVTLRQKSRISILSLRQTLLVSVSETHLPFESMYCGWSGLRTSHTTATWGSTLTGVAKSELNDPATA